MTLQLYDTEKMAEERDKNFQNDENDKFIQYDDENTVMEFMIDSETREKQLMK